MSTPERSFRERVRSGETVVGAFAHLASPITAEILGLAGLDWVVIDMEHGPGNEHHTLSQIQALAHTGTSALVRIESTERPRYSRALDLGATGVLVPRIESVQDARTAAENCRYSGNRGVARYNRAWSWGLDTRGLDDADAEVVCALQIETEGALNVVEEIAAIDGVDVLFVGPADLGHSLGINGGPDHPELLTAAGRVAEAARASGIAAGMMVGTAEQAGKYQELGFTFLGCGSDSGFVLQGAQKVATELRAL